MLRILISLIIAALLWRQSRLAQAQPHRRRAFELAFGAALALTGYNIALVAGAQMSLLLWVLIVAAALLFVGAIISLVAAWRSGEERQQHDKFNNAVLGRMTEREQERQALPKNRKKMMPASLHQQARMHFNAEDYRVALLCFEQHWHTDRSDVLRAMIQLCNALNQLRLGLTSGPRHNLASAARLLAPLPDRYADLPIADLRAYIATLQALLPAGVERVPWEQVPRIRLETKEQRSMAGDQGSGN